MVKRIGILIFLLLAVLTVSCNSLKGWKRNVRKGEIVVKEQKNLKNPQNSKRDITLFDKIFRPRYVQNKRAAKYDEMSDLYESYKFLRDKYYYASKKLKDKELASMYKNKMKNDKSQIKNMERNGYRIRKEDKELF